MPNYEWDPATYLELMHDELPGYEELQEATVAATGDLVVAHVLELGIGTGETALRLLARHPRLRLLGVDASGPMLQRARERLPHADLRQARLEDDLPPGPFDLVVSALAVHHLPSPAKRDLFRRVACVLRRGGRFVLADVVVPEAGGSGPIPIDGVMDLPDTASDQLAWLREAGFEARVENVRVDLAVFVGDRRF